MARYHENNLCPRFGQTSPLTIGLPVSHCNYVDMFAISPWHKLLINWTPDALDITKKISFLSSYLVKPLLTALYRGAEVSLCFLGFL